MRLVNKTGYLKGAKTAKNPVNIIPSNVITTQGMAFPIKANGKTLYPNTGQYKFPTSPVVETPLKKKGTNDLVPNKMSKTSLSKAQEIAYQRWMKSKGYNESDDYDMRDYWKNEGFKNLGSPKGGDHFPDTYKRLAPFSEGDNYPTLSDESNRASKFDKRGQGTWTKEGKYVNYQEGTEELNNEDTANEEIKASKASQFTYRIKDKKRRDTQVRDMYNNTLDSFRGDTTNAKRMFKNFFKSYGSERFNDVKPLEGYYGFDMKDYSDKTLDSLGRDWHKKMKFSKKQQGTKNTKSNDDFRSGLSPAQQKEYDQYVQATKRGLSLEGLGDLALGLSGEALIGAGIKAGSRLYKAASPYLKKAYNVAKGYGEDLIESSKQAGKLKFPTYENLYRWHPDYVPESLETAGKLLTPEQQALTGRWFSTNIKQTPFYVVTRPAPGNLKVVRTTKLKARQLENSLSPEAKGMSGKTSNMPTSDTHHPGEVILSPDQIAKAKNIRFNENPAVNASMHPDYQKLESQNVLKSYKRGMLEDLVLPELQKSVKHLEKPILGINRKFFPFKNGSKLIKYKNGSKSVSLAFSRGEKDPKGGLTQKGVDKYNRATGGNLKMAVTTPPSKLKPGSKAANRRKSFCARMSGVKGPMAKNGKPTRKALALRKWNC